MYNSQVADETRFDRAMNAGRILLVAKSSFWMLKFACLVVGKSSIHPSSPPLYAHYIYIYILVGGIPTPLKNMKVSWDDDIPNIWKNKGHVPNIPNHQPVHIYIYMSDIKANKIA